MIFTLLKGRLSQAVAGDLLDFDLVTIVIAYLLLRYGQGPASVYAFGQGLFIDIVSGGPEGFSTLICLAVFLGLHLGSRFLDIERPRSQIVLVAIVVALKEILLLGLLNLFVPRVIIVRFFPLLVAGSMVVTALSVPLLFGVFDYLVGLPEEDSAGG
ncbi:MAG TPA: rod shape-determining protein MreD [Desulfobacteraceae bacterium]|nr:MAG: rod shape-determining protein MreD [Desulfobacteraceae bacterium 4484_190.3]RLB18353.1 MAG: rod shape-determining protein MreD [Deltaproteobacteria bacterium]HDZ23023.1 rod shape-determining protein MreD [Desulfobacteraceae bacterium]